MTRKKIKGLPPRLFREALEIDDETFEFYSQKSGKKRRAKPSTVRGFMSVDWNSDPLSGVPSSSGNVDNLNEFRVDSSGDLWFIDRDGDGLNFSDFFGGQSLWSEDGGDVYRATGFVGIGLDNPNHSLHVNGRARFNESIGVNISASTVVPLVIKALSSTVVQQIRDSSSVSKIEFRVDSSGNSSIRNFDSDGVNNYFINPGGVSWIGRGLSLGMTSSTDKILDVNGSARFRGLIYDMNNSSGSVGQVLKRSTSGVEWEDEGVGADTNIKNTNFSFDETRNNSLNGFNLNFAGSGGSLFSMSGLASTSAFGGGTEALTRLVVFGKNGGSIVKMVGDGNDIGAEFKFNRDVYFPKYNSSSAVSGTEVALAGFDSSGKLLTLDLVSGGGGNRVDVSANYTTGENDDVLWVDASSGVVVTLSDDSNFDGNWIEIIRTDNSTTSTLLVISATGQINNVNTGVSISGQWSVRRFNSDGTDFVSPV